MTSEKTAEAAARAIEEKLGEDIAVLDLRGRSALADFFVIASAGSTIHAQAIAEHVRELLREAGEKPHHVEGTENATWVLLDYLDVVVHILLGETREFYGLERLWGDVPEREFHDNTSAGDSA